MAHPLKNHSKFSKMALWPQNFPRLRRAKGGFALGNVPHTPESATLTPVLVIYRYHTGMDCFFDYKSLVLVCGLRKWSSTILIRIPRLRPSRPMFTSKIAQVHSPQSLFSLQHSTKSPNFTTLYFVSAVIAHNTPHLAWKSTSM